MSLHPAIPQIVVTMASALAAMNVSAQPLKKPAALPTPAVADGVIVKVKPVQAARAMSVDTARALSASAKASLSAKAQLATGAVLYRIDANGEQDPTVIAARLRASGEVEYAVPNYAMHELAAPPNDPYLVQQWGLFPRVDFPGGAQFGNAWDVTRGSSQIVVAVVDGGVRPGHPDLAGRLLPGYDFVSADYKVSLGYPSNWYAADGNGRDSDPTDPGSYVDATLRAQLPTNLANTTALQPSSWHGTHVAGTIAANGDNLIGVSGGDWNARIVPVRVLGRAGSGSLIDIIDGIAWAAGFPVANAPANPNPAHVINLSLGSVGSCDPAIWDVISRVIAAGKTVVAAAGNDALAVNAPANCPGVIAVAAHAVNGDNAEYSSFGPQVTLSAPGGGCGFKSFNSATGACSSASTGIYSTVNAGTTVPLGEGYGPKQGTSMAAPHVSAAVALMLALAPKLAPAEVKSVLQSSTAPHPAGSTCATVIPGGCGTGLLDAGAAVARVRDNLPTVSIGSNSVVRPGSPVGLIGSAASSLAGTMTYQWRQTAGPSVALVSANSLNAAFVAPATGALAFELRATHPNGYEAVATRSVTVNSPPVVNQLAPVRATVGTTVSGQLTGLDADSDSFIFVATEQPAGFTLNTQTGVYTWSPTSTGSSNLIVVGVDGMGNGAPMVATLTAEAVGAPAPTTPTTPTAPTAPTGGSSAVAPSGGGGSVDPFAAALLMLAGVATVRRRARPTTRCG